ncbi:transglutaminase [Cohaesibacter sp. CAU 1516]|nr:transglutaminase [Cohaesibacter sp. CAU 1516]
MATSCFVTTASASSSRFMVTTGNTSAPIGHIKFCRRNPSECDVRFETDRAVKLTQTNWSQLISINGDVNRTIRPITDQDQYRTEEFWTYPTTAGDCEDYALLKRRILINARWPETALLITVVRESDGSGHAVLTVRTDRGDLILDNQDPRILPWSKTPYRFIKRQAALQPGSWTAIHDPR